MDQTCLRAHVKVDLVLGFVAVEFRGEQALPNSDAELRPLAYPLEQPLYRKPLIARCSGAEVFFAAAIIATHKILTAYHREPAAPRVWADTEIFGLAHSSSLLGGRYGSAAIAIRTIHCVLMQPAE